MYKAALVAALYIIKLILFYELEKLRSTMKTHTTNYQNTFITIADDCAAVAGEVPAIKGDKKTIANLQFELIHKHPYKFTSDELLFKIYAERNDLTDEELPAARAAFFSKGQACLRASPLAKRYGWGIHSNAAGQIAIYGCETDEYQKLKTDKELTVVKAMRSSKN